MPGVTITLCKVPEYENAIVTDAGSPETLGEYTYRGMHGGKPYRNLIGASDNPVVSALSAYNDTFLLWMANGDSAYSVTEDVDDIFQVTEPWLNDGNGAADPIPTITRSDKFVDVLEITTKRFFEYSSFRKKFILQIAAVSAELIAAVAESTHVRVEDANGSTVYVIDDDDVVPPQSTDVVWNIACDVYERRDHYSTL